MQGNVYNLSSATGTWRGAGCTSCPPLPAAGRPELPMGPSREMAWLLRPPPECSEVPCRGELPESLDGDAARALHR